jgi:hypothetical protein
MFLMLCTQMKIYVCDVVSECVRTGQAAQKVCLTAVGIDPATFGLPVQSSTNRAPRSSRFEWVILILFFSSYKNGNLFSRYCYPSILICFIVSNGNRY